MVPGMTQLTPNPDKLGVSLDEAADMVGISRSTALALVQAGEWPSKRVGRRYVIPLEGLKAWLADPKPALNEQ